MARFRYQHIKSSVEGKAPTAAQLKVAEIGVNDFAGDEKLFIKNNTGDVVDFPRGYSREYIDDNERVIAEAFNDLNSRKMDSSAYTEIWESGVGESSAVLKGSSGTASGDYSVAEGHQTSGTGVASHAEGQGTQANGSYSHAEGYYTETKNESEHVSGRYNVSSSASTTFGDSGNTLFSVGNGISSINKHNAFEIRQNGDIYIVNKDGDDVRLQDEIGNIDVDQVLNDTTSASTNPVSSKAVYKAVTDNELVWTNAYVVISGAISSHTEDTSIHVTSADKEKINSIATLSGTVTAHTENTEIHVTAADKEKLHTHSNKAALDSITGNVGTMAYEDKASYSSATEVNTALGSKANTATTLAGYGITNAYTKSETSGATELETAFNGKANTSDIADFFDDAKYELSGTTHVINFYNGNTIKATIDATDFIKDGMIDSVSLETTGDTTYLVITWNTDAGKSQTSLNVGDLFDADNYYTKSQTSGATELSTEFAKYYTTAQTSGATELSTAFDTIDDLVGSGFTSSSITDVIIENEEIVSEALTDLDGRKLDASAYTPTDLSNYYTKSETSGKTELTTAFSAKADTATTLAGYGITDAYTKTETSGATEISNALGGKLDASEYATFSAATNTSIEDLSGQSETIAAALNDLDDRKLDTSAYTPTDLSNYYTKSETSGATELSTEFAKYYTTAQTSGATEIENALNAKVNTADIVTAITPSNSGSTNPIATSVIAENEKIVSNALIDLSSRKLDASAYTPTDLSNYYTKSETSGATELTTAFSAKANTATTLAGYGITDAYTKSETSGATELTTAFSAKADKTSDLDGLKLKKITQDAYDALTVKDPNTLYVIVN